MRPRASQKVHPLENLPGLLSSTRGGNQPEEPGPQGQRRCPVSSSRASARAVDLTTTGCLENKLSTFPAAPLKVNSRVLDAGHLPLCISQAFLCQYNPFTMQRLGAHIGPVWALLGHPALQGLC